MSRTEQAIQALVAALTTESSAIDPRLPTIHRNEVLPTRLEEFGEAAAFVNVLDGDGETLDVALGGGIDGSVNAYQLKQSVQIEVMIEADDRDAREAAFDRALEAIDDVIKSEIGGAAPRSLGDVVSWAEIERIDRSNLSTDGLPGTKAAIVTVALTFLSDRPF